MYYINDYNLCSCSPFNNIVITVIFIDYIRDYHNDTYKDIIHKKWASVREIKIDKINHYIY